MSISVSRLYDGTRRAKPIVSTSGLNTLSVQPSSASANPRCSWEARTRCRISSTSRSRSVRRSAQISSSETLSIASQPMPSCSWSYATSRSASSSTAGDIQVGACTPLVTELIGTSSASKPGHSGWNISRLTRPCSLLTPFARWASRSPMWAMLNTPGSVSAPSSSTRSTGSADHSGCSKWWRTWPRPNRSMPAGTGVWVVKTVPARTACSASSNVSPVLTSSRIRSTPRKPAWPSLVWNTSGSVPPVSRVYARTARTPPTPASSSWSRRCSLLPPYSLSVICRSAASFSSMSESSSSSGTRPTCAFHTWARSVRWSGRASETRTGVPSASRSTASGRPCGSMEG